MGEKKPKKSSDVVDQVMLGRPKKTRARVKKRKSSDRDLSRMHPHDREIAFALRRL